LADDALEVHRSSLSSGPAWARISISSSMTAQTVCPAAHRGAEWNEMTAASAKVG
jgi:hypothetical protein